MPDCQVLQVRKSLIPVQGACNVRHSTTKVSLRGQGSQDFLREAAYLLNELCPFLVSTSKSSSP